MFFVFSPAPPLGAPLDRPRAAGPPLLPAHPARRRLSRIPRFGLDFSAGLAVSLGFRTALATVWFRTLACPGDLDLGFSDGLAISLV